MRFLAALLLMSVATPIFADTYVNGYTRKDGTYVRPHVRSSPDSSRANNYGPSENSWQLMNPRSRDADGDGSSNYLDNNDDNDSYYDNQDSSQYGGSGLVN